MPKKSGSKKSTPKPKAKPRKKRDVSQTLGANENTKKLLKQLDEMTK